MKGMFSNCYKLRNIEFQNIFSPKLLSMEEKFENCKNLINATFLNFDTPNSKSLKRIFKNCMNLREVKLENILENANISQIESLEEMLSFCRYLYYYNIENISFTELVTME